MGSARTARWEFFVTRWAAIAEFVSGTLKQSSADAAAAAGARPHLSAREVERLTVAARKAGRTRAVLHQLQEYDGRHVQLELRIRPLLDGLPALQAALSAPAPPPTWPLALQAALWQAKSSEQQHRQQQQQQQEGKEQQPGKEQQQQQEQRQDGEEQHTQAFPDRFGIAAALGGGPGIGPLRPALTTCTWRAAARAPARVAGAAQRLIEGPALDQLARFCADRRGLTAELAALSRQLEGAAGDDAGLPSTAPLEAACAALEARLPALREREAACVALLQRAVARVDWAALGARLERRAAEEAAEDEHARRGGLRAAGDYAGATPLMVAAAWPELAAALNRLMQADAALARGRAPPPSAWQELVDDAAAVARVTAALADSEEDAWEWGLGEEEANTQRRDGGVMADGGGGSVDSSGGSGGGSVSSGQPGALRRLCAQRLSAAVFAAHMADFAAAGDGEQSATA